MSGSFLLDTNIVIALFAGERSVRLHLESGCPLYLPSVVLGELCYGACASRHKEDNLRRIEDLAKLAVPLPCNAETARCYGEIKNGLRKKGRPIPENDVWIAAIAIQNHLTLVSRDRHFNEIDNLEHASW